MFKILSAVAWLGLGAALVILPGCATSESDLNYTRDKPSDHPGDNSYHGWNDANYSGSVKIEIRAPRAIRLATSAVAFNLNLPPTV